MKVNSISTHYVNQKQRTKLPQNNVNFGKIVAQVANDSFAPQVKKGLNLFMDYMRNLSKSAINGDKKSIKKLTGLIGKDATQGILENATAYTNQTKQVTKALPLSGHGTRGAEIRNMITNALGIPQTNKTDLILPAIIGNHKGKDIYLTTANNELLHMMEAKALSPFEKIDWITTAISEGDATVLVKGLELGKISKRKPLLFTYTDDVGTKGYKDYTELLKRYKEIGGASTKTKTISRGFLAPKTQAEGKLGVFLPQNDAFKVIEKPKMADMAIVKSDKVQTNIGKTLITPAGLDYIDGKRISDPISLTKDDFNFSSSSTRR